MSDPRRALDHVPCTLLSVWSVHKADGRVAVVMYGPCGDDELGVFDSIQDADAAIDGYKARFYITRKLCT